MPQLPGVREGRGVDGEGCLDERVEQVGVGVGVVDPRPRRGAGVPILVVRHATSTTVETLGGVLGRIRIREERKVARARPVIDAHLDSWDPGNVLQRLHPPRLGMRAPRVPAAAGEPRPGRARPGAEGGRA